MWFNNLSVYEYESKKDSIEIESYLNEQLTQDALKPCPSHARFIYGWSNLRPDEYVHTVMGGHFIILGKEERILPRGVIKHVLNERVQAIEGSNPHSVPPGSL